ncbi:MAG: hypothetical protein BJ554DRAFT_3306 [Olpidium bornovanus]|uniref:CBS domain-containing protein n=1 Tax=Olpidium bornovanus TaxID=278681 RepID=A0A8H7ZNN5_9FUNG|nr:MAG: hypothetical protein BJ554DRAFT_3306 [Olpidium bornovanus]
MLTVSTFVRLFHKYSSHPSPAAALEEIEQLQVQGWQDMERKAGAADPSLLKLHPSESLYEATKLLVNSRSHKLPVVDVDSTSKRELVVSVLTQYRIIKYIAANSLAELRIGTYENLVTATLDTSVVHLINLFVKKSITVVPILENGNPGDRRFFSSVRLRDAGPHLRLCKGLVSLTFLDVFRTSTGIVVNVYEQRDVMVSKGRPEAACSREFIARLKPCKFAENSNLARGGLHYDLSMPVSEALLLRPEVSRRDTRYSSAGWSRLLLIFLPVVSGVDAKTFEGVHTCTPDESLCSVFETMKTSPVHRLIVVDVDNSLVGVVSLGDLLKFFID